MERKYKSLEPLSDDEINQILKGDDIDALITLPLSVGEYHLNWKYAQKLCVKLSEHPDARVRANAVLGLAYIARTKGKLEKFIVKPVVLRALNENKEFEWRIIDSIDDINLFMKWNLGKNALNRGIE